MGRPLVDAHGESTEPVEPGIVGVNYMITGERADAQMCAYASMADVAQTRDEYMFMLGAKHGIETLLREEFEPYTGQRVGVRTRARREMRRAHWKGSVEFGDARGEA